MVSGLEVNCYYDCCILLCTRVGQTVPANVTCGWWMWLMVLSAYLRRNCGRSKKRTTRREQQASNRLERKIHVDAVSDFPDVAEGSLVSV